MTIDVGGRDAGANSFAHDGCIHSHPTGRMNPALRSGLRRGEEPGSVAA